MGSQVILTRSEVEQQRKLAPHNALVVVHSISLDRTVTPAYGHWRHTAPNLPLVYRGREPDRHLYERGHHWAAPPGRRQGGTVLADGQ